MPKRVIDFDAMWSSDKLAACAEWAQAEYAWLYGLADASGCFEMTNLRVIWGRVAAIRRNLTIERLDQILEEFQDKGLLFAWEDHGKRYGHWTGSDVPGRLPPPSWRARLERLAPPVPKQQFAQYMSGFSRGRASAPGGGFGGQNSPSVCAGVMSDVNVKTGQSKGAQTEVCATKTGDGGLQVGLEETQAQDWNWNLNLNGERESFRQTGSASAANPAEGVESRKTATPYLNSNAQKTETEVRRAGEGGTLRESAAAGLLGNAMGAEMETGVAREDDCSGAERRGEIPRCARNDNVKRIALTRGAAYGAAEQVHYPAVDYARRKSALAARELAVGQLPYCGPVRVRPQVLERVRARDGSRGP